MVDEDSSQPSLRRRWLPVLWIRLTTGGFTAGINPGCPSSGVIPSGSADRLEVPREAPRNMRHAGLVEIRPQMLLPPGVGRRVLVWSRGGWAPRPWSALQSPSQGQASAQAPQLPSQWGCSEQRGLCDGWESNLLRGEKQKKHQKKQKQQLPCLRAWQLS